MRLTRSGRRRVPPAAPRESQRDPVTVRARGLSVAVPDRCLFQDLNFSVEDGQCLAVVGPSGSGKTTLLSCVAGIVAPSRGVVEIDGASVWERRAVERAAYRLRNVGLVFQFGDLIPELTLLENVALPLRLLGAAPRAAGGEAFAWLERLGIADRAQRRSAGVSGGEMQRAAIARALVHRPRVVLADEPTGALDEDNARTVIELLVETAREANAAVIVATHDPVVSGRADVVVPLRAAARA